MNQKHFNYVWDFKRGRRERLRHWLGILLFPPLGLLLFWAFVVLTFGLLGGFE